jgi:hypothetical protein
MIALAWVMAAGPSGGRVDKEVAPQPKPPLGRMLILPRPRTLPCERFQTVALEVGEDTDRLSYDEAASVSWRGAGRDWTFVASVWTQPPAPLGVAAFPNRVRFSTMAPHKVATLKFYCRRYDRTEKGELRRDSDPFLGVQWLCTADGCVATAGYPLPWSLARSRRRLRLCDKTSSQSREEEYPGVTACRDVAPAAEDSQKALALAGELVADARRVVEDGCRAPGVCDPRARASLMNYLRQGNWRPKEWSGLPAGLTFSAVDGDRVLGLDCNTHMGDAHCNLKLHKGSTPLLTYMAIDTRDSPAEALLWLGNDRGGVFLTAASGDLNDHEPGACSVSGQLLSVR